MFASVLPVSLCSVVEGKRSPGVQVVWVARNRFAVLDKTHQVWVGVVVPTCTGWVVCVHASSVCTCLISVYIEARCMYVYAVYVHKDYEVQLTQ